METGYQHFKKSVTSARREEEKQRDAVTSHLMTSELSGANQAHMALVLFCDNFLRQRDDGKLPHSFEAACMSLVDAIIVGVVVVVDGGSGLSHRSDLAKDLEEHKNLRTPAPPP